MTCKVLPGCCKGACVATLACRRDLAIFAQSQRVRVKGSKSKGQSQRVRFRGLHVEQQHDRDRQGEARTV